MMVKSSVSRTVAFLLLLGVLFLGCMQLTVAFEEDQETVPADYVVDTTQDDVTGDNYPPPPLVELLLKVMSMMQLAGIVLAMLGGNAFRMIGMQQPPSWYTNVVEKNAMPIAIFLYLLLPQVLSKYVVTGAFEVIMDQEITIFSKLATGRLPQMADLVEPLVKAGLVQI
ncbi:hypothetical protein IV203_001945 [Nitzschia inconspicua]|uniref:Uncharacterized protein n=2 Tax=Nitzschia inconspicua TaxID=303405 RepID=A0A9K3L822_9STRA|nr:hypothetical protein IV203_001945 [Nitzschia inconspicua]